MRRGYYKGKNNGMKEGNTGSYLAYDKNMEDGPIVNGSNNVYEM
jgi:hypothetical protein